MENFVHQHATEIAKLITLGCVFENIAIRRHQKIAAHLKQMILLEMTGASGTQTSFGCGLQLTTMDPTVLTQLVFSSSVTILL
jgi:hypothetical protein